MDGSIGNTLGVLRVQVCGTGLALVLARACATLPNLHDLNLADYEHAGGLLGEGRSPLCALDALAKCRALIHLNVSHIPIYDDQVCALVFYGCKKPRL